MFNRIFFVHLILVLIILWVCYQSFHGTTNRSEFAKTEFYGIATIIVLTVGAMLVNYKPSPRVKPVKTICYLTPEEEEQYWKERKEEDELREKLLYAHVNGLTQEELDESHTRFLKKVEQIKKDFTMGGGF